jgi:hypothetical protein
MDRTDLQRLSKDELIELVIQLQRPDKTSRNSSKPPSTDKKEKRENSRPGGAKPGHEPHNRRLADNPDEFRDHRPTRCDLCGGSVSPDADMELIGEYDEIEIPPVKPYPAPAGFQHVDNPADYAPIVDPRLAPRVSGEVRRNLRKLGVGQPKTVGEIIGASFRKL